jgi:hypothetical protein
MTCEELVGAYLGSLGQRFFCKAEPSGRLCVVTPYTYPDHDNVEIFVRERSNGIVVSDLGETMRRLDTLGMDVLETPNLSYTAHRIADGFGVTIRDGIILKEGPRETAGQLVFEILSVCKAVGSLIYGSKAYKPMNFKEEVKQFLVSHRFRVEPKVTESGTTGKRYKVAFRVYVGGTQAALVEPLSPQKSVGIKKKIDATFRMWADIDVDRAKKVSFLNDELLHFDPADVAILKRFSDVYRWTRREELLSHLTRLGPGSVS